MSKTLSFLVSDNQHEALEQVAKSMRTSVSETAIAALMQSIDGFEINGDRELELMQSLRLFVDSEQVPSVSN
jgi:predicted transcriptional regulator